MTAEKPEYTPEIKFPVIEAADALGFKLTDVNGERQTGNNYQFHSIWTQGFIWTKLFLIYKLWVDKMYTNEVRLQFEEWKHNCSSEENDIKIKVASLF